MLSLLRRYSLAPGTLRWGARFLFCHICGQLDSAAPHSAEAAALQYCYDPP